MQQNLLDATNVTVLHNRNVKAEICEKFHGIHYDATAVSTSLTRQHKRHTMQVPTSLQPGTHDRQNNVGQHLSPTVLAEKIVGQQIRKTLDNCRANAAL